MVERENISVEEMIHFLKKTKEISIDLANQLEISESEQRGFRREIQIIDAIISTIKDSQYILK